MANFINKYSDLAAYNADETKEYPNVSYLETENEVKWQATEPIDQEHVVAKYDVVDTTGVTRILNNTSNITYMIVDGVQQPSVTTGFTFSTTGEHKVKYKVNASWNNNTFIDCKNLISITIPDSATKLGNQIFWRCSGLTSVHIGSGVTNIGDRAFDECRSLTTLTIPDSVSGIGTIAVARCTGLTSVHIGSGVTSFGASVFYDCTSLSAVTITTITPPTIGTNSFDSTNNCPIYVPSASVNAYKTASGWSNYASRIQAIPS